MDTTPGFSHSTVFHTVAATYWLNQRPDWRERVPFFSVLALDEEPNGQVNIEFLPDAFV